MSFLFKNKSYAIKIYSRRICSIVKINIKYGKKGVKSDQSGKNGNREKLPSQPVLRFRQSSIYPTSSSQLFKPFHVRQISVFHRFCFRRVLLYKRLLIYNFILRVYFKTFTGNKRIFLNVEMFFICDVTLMKSFV